MHSTPTLTPTQIKSYTKDSLDSSKEDTPALPYDALPHFHQYFSLQPPLSIFLFTFGHIFFHITPISDASHNFLIFPFIPAHTRHSADLALDFLLIILLFLVSPFHFVYAARIIDIHTTLFDLTHETADWGQSGVK